MITHLRGTVTKLSPGHVAVDVQGVGYGVHMTMQDWDAVPEQQQLFMYVSTFVREDRLELFGFMENTTRQLFSALIDLPGIGPRMGLEFCDVPRDMLGRAVREHDTAVLMSVKGVGKKSAEKLLVELSSLAERQPHIFAGTETGSGHAKFDQDTIDALSQLGFARPDILNALNTLDTELDTTEERIAAALRVL